MAVKLRLRRMGKIRQPIYKVVAADARSPRDGKFIEAIGVYHPKTDPIKLDINEERALYWLGVGAQPTTTVRNLLSKQGILFKKRLLKSGLSEEEANARVEAWKKDKESKVEALSKQRMAEAAKKKAEAEKAKKEAEKKAKVEAEVEKAKVEPEAESKAEKEEIKEEETDASVEAQGTDIVEKPEENSAEEK